MTTDLKRPIEIYYYKGSDKKVESWSRKSHAKSPLGAIRAATTNLLIGKATAAHVYNLEMGARICILQRKGRTITIVGWFESITFEQEFK